MSFVTMKCYQMNSKDMLAACDVRIYVYTHLNLHVNMLLDFWGTAELSKKRMKKEKERESVWENDCGEKCASKTDFNRKYEGSRPIVHSTNSK